MIDYIRKNARIIPLDGNDQFMPTTLENYSDLKEVLDGAIQQLPDVQRAVVLLRDYEGYSYKEIGKLTDLNEAQVKVYIYRARIFLKKYIVSPDLVV